MISRQQYKAEVDPMKDVSFVSNKQGEMQSLPVSVDENQDMRNDGSSDSLAIIIDNRAYEISQQGGEPRGPSLASWLKAAREILSEDSERPQLTA
jgi:hypothetical protein